MPAFGGDTISARWPLPIGMIRSMTRVVSRSGVVSSRRRWFGYSGVSLLKSSALPRVVDRSAVDGVEPHQRVELLPLVGLLAVLGHPHRAGDRVTAAQAVLAHHVHRHVDVVRAGQIAGGPDERVVVEDVEDARNGLNDVVFTQLGVAVATAATAAALAATFAAPAVTEPAVPAAATALAVVIACVAAAGFWPLLIALRSPLSDRLSRFAP